MSEATTLGKGVQGVIMRAFRSRDYRITVTGARNITDHYRRVFFEAAELLAAHPPQPAMWIRLWCPGPDRLYQRAYTLVDPDPAAGTFSLDFALHEQGYAMDFARGARPGDVLDVSVLGRDEYVRPDPLPPGYLMVADPASLPAVNSILPTLPDDYPVRLFVGRQHEGDEQLPLARAAGVDVRWLDHADLVRVVTSQVGDVRGWFGWVCVDTEQTRAIKEVVRAATGAGKRDGHAMGYWTKGKPTG